MSALQCQNHTLLLPLSFEKTLNPFVGTNFKECHVSSHGCTELKSLLPSCQSLTLASRDSPLKEKKNSLCIFLVAKLPTAAFLVDKDV